MSDIRIERFFSRKQKGKTLIGAGQYDLMQTDPGFQLPNRETIEKVYVRG